MTDLPLDLRQKLSAELPLYSHRLHTLSSAKGTKKALLRLADGQHIETVLMEYDGWLTACLSSQVGCPLKCSFCATGKLGFTRNLTPEEIIDQILFWHHQLVSSDQYVGRIVFMGMGEPFLNWDNVKAAISIINDPESLNIGARKISLSTAGITDHMADLAKLNDQINLATSLHAPNQTLRLKLMPIAARYPLPQLLSACANYVRLTNRQLFFKYALIDQVNDSPDNAIQLADLIVSNRLYFLNLIPLNPVSGGLKPSSNARRSAFINLLDRRQVPFSIRKSFGSTINAACGQLAGKINHNAN